MTGNRRRARPSRQRRDFERSGERALGLTMSSSARAESSLVVRKVPQQWGRVPDVPGRWPRVWKNGRWFSCCPPCLSRRYRFDSEREARTRRKLPRLRGSEPRSSGNVRWPWRLVRCDAWSPPRGSRTFCEHVGSFRCGRGASLGPRGAVLRLKGLVLCDERAIRTRTCALERLEASVRRRWLKVVQCRGPVVRCDGTRRCLESHMPTIGVPLGRGVAPELRA